MNVIDFGIGAVAGLLAGAALALLADGQIVNPFRRGSAGGHVPPSQRVMNVPGAAGPPPKPR